ncbi:MAG: LbtU family siderophore porin, partial [Gammaproteobacteria bacterium]|nr:LbtU family siderophore porin [Gammaproteobacteria bacterium]
MKQPTLASAVIAALALQSNAYAAEPISTSGVVEVEISSSEGTSDIGLATAELGFSAAINKSTTADILFLYEGDTTDVDSASITYKTPDSPWSVTAGQIGVPFGSFATNMISDPLTLELGETSEDAVQLDYEAGNLTTSFYLFNGTNSVATADKIDNFGLNITHASDTLAVSFGYINDIGDSDGLQDANDVSNVMAAQVPGQSIALQFTAGSFTLIGEQVSAGEAFAAGEVTAAAIQPSATNIELAFGMGNNATLALGMQSSNDANGLLDKSRTMLGYAMA